MTDKSEKFRAFLRQKRTASAADGAADISADPLAQPHQRSIVVDIPWSCLLLPGGTPSSVTAGHPLATFQPSSSTWVTAPLVCDSGPNALPSDAAPLLAAIDRAIQESVRSGDGLADVMRAQKHLIEKWWQDHRSFRLEPHGPIFPATVPLPDQDVLLQLNGLSDAHVSSGETTDRILRFTLILPEFACARRDALLRLHRESPPSSSLFPLLRVGYHESMLLHDAPNPRYPERPNRISRAMDLIREDNVLFHLGAVELMPSASLRCATWEEIAPVHPTDAYRRFVLEGTVPSDLPSDVFCASPSTGSSTSETPTATGPTTNPSANAALMAAGIAISAVRSDRPTFNLIRPPGHHCCGQRPNGFCFLNNILVATNALLEDAERAGLEPRRVAIVDIDVHHGDGTQKALTRLFAHDDTTSGMQSPSSSSWTARGRHVAFLSCHRYDKGAFYPYTGAATSNTTHRHHPRGGEGDLGVVGGTLNIINVPFDTDRQSGLVICDAAFVRTFDEVFIPFLNDVFRPTHILVSCGFDAAEGDPLGQMGVQQGYAYVVAALAKQIPSCQGRIHCFLEGGYNVSVVAQKSLEVVSSLVASALEPKMAAAPRDESRVALPLQVARQACPRPGASELLNSWISRALSTAHAAGDV